jgi:hypothetical protein
MLSLLLLGRLVGDVHPKEYPHRERERERDKKNASF